MFNISSNGIVTINRGDSFEFPVTLNIGNSIDRENYVLTGTDTLYMGVMEPNQPFETAIIRKMITASDLDENNNIVIRFWPEDTVCLLPGKYYYQVKLETDCFDPKTNRTRKDVETVIDKNLFYIQE